MQKYSPIEGSDHRIPPHWAKLSVLSADLVWPMSASLSVPPWSPHRLAVQWMHLPKVVRISIAVIYIRNTWLTYIVIFKLPTLVFVWQYKHAELWIRCTSHRHNELWICQQPNPQVFHHKAVYITWFAHTTLYPCQEIYNLQIVSNFWKARSTNWDSLTF